ncbi:hypothetical protein niasHT_014148 [Heterodera trifolii]|uniref:3-hydroxy-3-methylglutaryl-coenzyme A reductase n=1 Tax=Heterodera trifolii TaxID=157864 RepID=A0ABD2KWX4_9BILA
MPTTLATTNCTIDLSKFSATLCTTVQQIVLDRLDKAFEEKIDDIGETKLRNARAQFWLIAEKIRDAVHEQCRQLTEQYNSNGETILVDNSARCRGPSFVIGDDSSSTTSATPSIASSGVHSSAACCSDEGVQVDMPTTPAVVATRAATNASHSHTQQRRQRHDGEAEGEAVVAATTAAAARATASVVTAAAAAAPATDASVLAELRLGMLKHRMLEQRCSPAKAVELRRRHLEERHKMGCLHLLPFEHYDYSEVKDACCENVVGFVPLPTGVAGPLYFDGTFVYLPLATTEGALVASVSRGCLSINEAISMLGNNAFSVHVFRDGMSRAPIIEFPCVRDSIECLRWVQQNRTFVQLKQIFEETSNYACLQRIDAHLEGTYLYLRFVASTGDAMGMNMVTKGTGRALALIKREFPQGTLVSISGNMCVDKKPSALNWIEGRGKSVVAEALIPAAIVERVLRTSVDKMVKLGHAKLLVGSSAAVTVGGWNAHAANVVAAMFLATGQDAAQVVSSSMCLTQLQHRAADNCGANAAPPLLHITCTMNCLEVGTVGGGTMLTPQGACLEMLGCRRAGLRPGQNAERFARLVCGAVLAGELSLLASQCTEGDLEKSHLRLNRSSRSLALNLAGGVGRSNGNSPQHSASNNNGGGGAAGTAPFLPYSPSSPYRCCSSSSSPSPQHSSTTTATNNHHHHHHHHHYCCTGGGSGSPMRDIPEHLPLSPSSPQDDGMVGDGTGTEREHMITLANASSASLLSSSSSAASSSGDRRKQQQQQQQHHLLQLPPRRQLQQQRKGVGRRGGDGTVSGTVTSTASSITVSSTGGAAAQNGGGIGSKLRKIGQMCEPL